MEDKAREASEDGIEDSDKSEDYEWVLIPHCNPDDKKNGITFKGDTPEYLRARNMIFDLFNKKGRILTINNRKLQILDNVKNQFKVEVKPPKGQSGKINIKIYPANKSGIATFMITKTKDSELVHVKTLAFKVIKYLIDGIIDGELNENDVNNFKLEQDEDLEKRKLMCHLCGKSFKMKNGINIHMEKVHEIMTNIDCDMCEKRFYTESELEVHTEQEHSLFKESCLLCGESFKTENDHNEHVKKKHEFTKEFKCEKCKFKFQDSKVLNEHTEKCGEKELNTEVKAYQSKCDYCDLKISAENEEKIKLYLSNHHKSCSFVPRQHEVGQTYCCKECGFSTEKEDLLKRHKRDVHDAVTVSTSPKPKKRKKGRSVVFMEVDESPRSEQIDESAMEIDDQSDILSRMWDEKIIRKNNKIEQEERMFLKEKEEKIKRELMEKEREKKEAEKQKKLRAKLKNKEKKEKEEYLQTKPYLKELPDVVKNVIGDDFYLYPVAGDGACALRSIAGWIFQDPSLGPYLGRNVNEHFVKNWHYWKNYFTFPYKRNIGNGGSKVFMNAVELLNFLKNAKDGAFMWRDHQDLAAISNIYRFKIKVITIDNTMDANPIIHIQEPDPNFKMSEEEFPPGKIAEMILCHVKNVHYDLIVPKDSKLANEGGLDFQRMKKIEKKEQKDECKDKQEHNDNGKKHEKNDDNKYKPEQTYDNKDKKEQNDDSKESQNLTLMLKGKIVKLEGLLQAMHEKVKTLEMEKVNRITEGQYSCYECDETFKTKDFAKKHMENHKRESKNGEGSYDGIECDKCELKCTIEKLLADHNKTHLEDKTFSCGDCNSKFTSKEYLQNHVAEHNKGVSINCQVCGEPCLSKEQLEKHISNEHNREEYACKICKIKYSTKEEFEEHKKTHTYYEYECQHCENRYKTKVQMENHVLEKHGVNVGKRAKQYNCKDCPFQGDGWSQLKKHIQSLGHNPVEFSGQCFTCKYEFTSYWKLMKHIKAEHPSNKKCRYFLRQECYFDSETCWYRHENDMKNEDTQFDCRECDETFSSRSDMRIHKKRKHPQSIQKCTNYLQGKCMRNPQTCWFRHDIDDSKSFEMETEEISENDLGFQYARVKTPPDQIQSIIEMLNKLSFKIERLEKRTLTKE